jgi:hypothetical protein
VTAQNLCPLLHIGLYGSIRDHALALLGSRTVTMSASYSVRTKELFQKYGKVAVGVHLTVYAAGLAGTERVTVGGLQWTVLRS